MPTGRDKDGKSELSTNRRNSKEEQYGSVHKSRIVLHRGILDEFLKGASGMAIVENFPTEGQETVIEWDESRQGFFPTEVRDSQ